MNLAGGICPVCESAFAGEDLISVSIEARAFCRSCLSILRLTLRHEPGGPATAANIEVDFAASVVRRALERLEEAERSGTLRAEVTAQCAEPARAFLLRVPPLHAKARSAFGERVRLLRDARFHLDWSHSQRRPPRPRPGVAPPAELPFRWPHETQLMAWQAPIAASDKLFDARTRDGSGRIFVPWEEYFTTDGWMTAGTVLPVDRFDPPRLALRPPELEPFAPFLGSFTLWAPLDLVEPV